MKSILMGLWVCIVSLGATYGGAYWKSHQTTDAAAQAHPPEKLEIKKVKPITVPVISGGQLRGYISGEFSFATEASDKHGEGGGHGGGGGGGGPDPESYFMDEAFRLIYSDNKLDFSHLEKMDLGALTKQITANVNQRMGKTVVKDTFVKNFTFIPKEDLPK